MSVDTDAAIAAFQSLRTKTSSGIPARGTTLFGQGRHGEDFPLGPSEVPDQSVAFPDRRVRLDARLRVARVADAAIVIQLNLRWESIFGLHTSIAAVQAMEHDGQITLTTKWQQTVPTPTLDNIEIHAGNVTAADYHQQTLDRLHAGGSSPLATLIFGGDSGREVTLAEFAALAQMPVTMVAEL